LLTKTSIGAMSFSMAATSGAMAQRRIDRRPRDLRKTHAPAAATALADWRAQGVLVQDEEIKRIVDFIGQRSKPRFETEIHQKLSKSTVLPADLAEEEDEELVEQAVEVIRQTNRASVSILQRRLRIGYTRAARIMDLLEERGIVGPNKGAEPRDILIDLDGKIPAEQ